MNYNKFNFLIHIQIRKIGMSQTNYYNINCILDDILKLLKFNKLYTLANTIIISIK